MRTRFDYRTKYKNMNIEKLTYFLDKKIDDLTHALVFSDDDEAARKGREVSYLKNKIKNLKQRT